MQGNLTTWRTEPSTPHSNVTSSYSVENDVGVNHNDVSHNNPYVHSDEHRGESIRAMIEQITDAGSKLSKKLKTNNRRLSCISSGHLNLSFDLRAHAALGSSITERFDMLSNLSGIMEEITRLDRVRVEYEYLLEELASLTVEAKRLEAEHNLGQQTQGSYFPENFLEDAELPPEGQSFRSKLAGIRWRLSEVLDSAKLIKSSYKSTSKAKR